jgi:hypothetical protein
MAIMEVLDAEGALREAARVLQPRGRLVASFSHPCFEVSVSSSGGGKILFEGRWFVVVRSMRVLLG